MDYFVVPVNDGVLDIALFAEGKIQRLVVM